MQGQWLQRNSYAFLSSISLPWEVLPTVTTTAIVSSVSPVVQIKSVDRDVTTVRTSTGVERMSNAVITNAPVVRPLVPVLIIIMPKAQKFWDTKIVLYEVNAFLWRGDWLRSCHNVLERRKIS